jgi:hypothetical protein
MNGQELVYTGIEIVLLTEFPELTDRMKNAFGFYYDLTSEMPQAYPVFEDVFQGFLIEKLLQDDSDEVLGRIFLFCERMARSKDAEVVNLLWISILVPLIYDANQTKRAWKHMGHTTRAVARDIAERRSWQSNLPPS